MPYAAPFIKLNVRGHFGPNATTPTEQWQCGFHIASKTGTITDPLGIAGFLTAISGAVTTYHTASLVGAGTRCYLSSLTGAWIGTDGKYVAGALQPTTVYTYGTPTPGLGSAQGPWSQSVALTLRSGRLRGPGSHGRVYWPGTAVAAIDTTGLISTAAQTGIRDAAVVLINKINLEAKNAFGTGWNVALCSNVGPGFTEIVDKVGVGARLDSIESRERNLLENHLFGNLVVSTTLQAERDAVLDEALRDVLDRPDTNPASEASGE